MKFSDYFSDEIRYPGNGILDDILPINTLYEYVSSTFLDGFINYVDIKCAYVLGRYYDWGEKLEYSKKIHDIEFWTKDELYNYLTTNDIFHSKLDTYFQDDVVLLTTSKNNSNLYCYFWYDRDCSDCCIGRFKTDDTYEVVQQKFSEYFDSNTCNEYGKREIPLNYFKGWIGS